MEYISEFRDHRAIKKLIDEIHQEVTPSQTYNLMEFCGGHTHALFRFGLIRLLPNNINMRHGPGCPVCILPISRIDQAIQIALEPNVTLCSYGDMLRVPGSGTISLQKAQAKGADVEMIYSPLDIIKMAQDAPNRQFVFFAVGFETTTPATAALMDSVLKLNIKNISVFCNHVLTPPAVTGILDTAEQQGGPVLNGLIGPGHVSIVTGTSGYASICDHYQIPIVISGFEPMDLLQSILMLVRQINQGTYKLENQYRRAVTPTGNTKAREIIARFFELRDEFEWRGLGMMPHSALQLKPAYAKMDAEQHFNLTPSSGQDNKACECPAVLTGRKSPLDCKLFGISCTPENPLGSCMVSSEGACAAYYNYQRTAKRG